jgi:hypothetical protein
MEMDVFLHMLQKMIPFLEDAFWILLLPYVV